MKIPVLRIYTIGYLLFLYCPILILPIFAFNDSTAVAFPLQGFTTEWFQNVFHDAVLGKALKNSLLVAASTAVISTFLGTLAARANTRYQFKAAGPLMGLIMLPMVLPEIIMAMALLVVLLSIGIPLSLFTIILGHVLVCTPFAVAILTSAFQSLDKSLEEAAYDLGEGPFSTFRLIILPLVIGRTASFHVHLRATSFSEKCAQYHGLGHNSCGGVHHPFGLGRVFPPARPCAHRCQR